MSNLIVLELGFACSTSLKFQEILSNFRVLLLDQQLSLVSPCEYSKQIWSWGWCYSNICVDKKHTSFVFFDYIGFCSRGSQRERDRERAQARAGGKGKTKDDGLTPEQRRERWPDSYWPLNPISGGLINSLICVFIWLGMQKHCKRRRRRKLLKLQEQLLPEEEAKETIIRNDLCFCNFLSFEIGYCLCVELCFLMTWLFVVWGVLPSFNGIHFRFEQWHTENAKTVYFSKPLWW